MVERPIKKSDRQPKLKTDNNSENLDSTPSVEFNPKSSKRRDDRSENKGNRGKKGSGDETKQPINPALARGPRPVKPQVNIKTEPETESEPVSEESQE